MKMTEKDILQVLKTHHSTDVFIPHCKTGPSWGNPNLRIFDAWVLNRSWVNLCTIGYEIKVNKNDFKRDTKWQEYLSYCHKFYFICPQGLIQPNEIPSKEVGLYWISEKSNYMYIKKYAIKRNIEIQLSLLLHILISRVAIIRPQELERLKNENKQLREYLNKKEKIN